MRFHILFFLLLTAASCAPSRFIKPLSQNQHAVSASFGGPMTNVPGVGSIPIPHTSLGYGYGWKKNTTIYGNWYSTAAVFGVVQVDCGITQRIWQDKKEKMGISFSTSFNYMTDVFEKNTRIWPQLDANYYFTYLSKTGKTKKTGTEKTISNYFYAGFTNWFELQNDKAHGEPQKKHMIFCPQIGHTFERTKWNFTIESKFIAPNLSNQNIVVDYVSPFSKRGGFGIYLGISYKL